VDDLIWSRIQRARSVAQSGVIIASARDMERYVEPEWLDALPADAPAAIGSRRDLRRLNAWMGNARRLAQVLRTVRAGAHPVHLVEVGAGDGDLLLNVARRMGDGWKGTEVTLVDLQNLLSTETSDGFHRAGWKVSVIKSDVFDWCLNASIRSSAVVVANLFLHHFHPRELEQLLHGIKQRSVLFAAMEPRRSRLSLLSSRMVGLIGCNAVTRHDAPASVRAGFAGTELSMNWGINDGVWELNEGSAGLFGHMFVARKRSLGPALSSQ
jgi:hypothetical protein